MKLLINYRFPDYLCCPFLYGFKYGEECVYTFGSLFGLNDHIRMSYIQTRHIGFYGGLISKGTKPINPKLENRYKYFKRVYLSKF